MSKNIVKLQAKARVESAENAAKQLRDQQAAARLIGWRKHFGRLAVAYTQTLLSAGTIKLPKDQHGVRCMMEMRMGELSRESHKVIIGLLDQAEKKTSH